MKKLISLLVALVLVVTCLAGISFAADPLFEMTIRYREGIDHYGNLLEPGHPGL